jgi:hypothetical protein
MALHTVSSVSQVLRLSDTFTSIGNRHLLVDFAPFRRKSSKRYNRRFTPFISPVNLRRSSVKAVLQLDNHLDPAPPPSSTSDLKPQVRFLYPLLFLHRDFFFFLLQLYWFLKCFVGLKHRCEKSYEKMNIF